MTEQVQEVEQEVVVEEAPPEEQVEVESDSQPEPPKKDEWVELNPDAQRKFDNMYKQVKMSDQRNKFLMEANEKALKRIEELENRFKDTDQAQAENIILQRIQEARDNGDTQAELKLISELTDFKAEQKIKGIKQPEKKQEPAVDYGLPEEDIDYLKDVVFEKDASGNYIRPWLHEGNPRYQTTLRQSAIISAEVEAELGYIDPREVMSRLEKVMNKPKPNPRAADPLQSSLTTKSPRGTLKLSQAEAAMAEKLGIDPKVYAQSRENLKKQGR